MPKEVITNPFGSGFDVRIGWGHGQVVQIGVESTEGRSLPWMLYGQPETKAHLGELVRTIVEDCRGSSPADARSNEDVGTAVLNALDVLASGVSIDTENPEQPGYTYMGVWADLDRQGCNEMIRHLRRARDAAFGRDE